MSSFKQVLGCIRAVFYMEMKKVTTNIPSEDRTLTPQPVASHYTVFFLIFLLQEQ